MDNFNKRLHKRLEDNEFKVAWNEYETKFNQIKTEIMDKYSMSKEQFEEFIDKWNSLDNVNAVFTLDENDKLVTNEMRFVKVTVPNEGCPKGRVIVVHHIQDNGTIYGMNAEDDKDWTSYYIPKGEYEFIKYK